MRGFSADQSPAIFAALGQKNHLAILRQQSVYGWSGETDVAEKHHLRNLRKRQAGKRFALQFHLQAAIMDAQLSVLLHHVERRHIPLYF